MHPGSSFCHIRAHTGRAAWRREAGIPGTVQDLDSPNSDHHSLPQRAKHLKKKNSDIVTELKTLFILSPDIFLMCFWATSTGEKSNMESHRSCITDC